MARRETLLQPTLRTGSPVVMMLAFMFVLVWCHACFCEQHRLFPRQATVPIVPTPTTTGFLQPPTYTALPPIVPTLPATTTISASPTLPNTIVTTTITTTFTVTNTTTITTTVYPPAPTVSPSPTAAPVPTGEPSPTVVPVPTGETSPTVVPVPTGETSPTVAPVPTGETSPTVAPVPILPPTTTTTMTPTTPTPTTNTTTCPTETPFVAPVILPLVFPQNTTNMTAWAILSNHTQFSNFTYIVNATSTQLVALLNSTQTNITVFAPPNEVFEPFLKNEALQNFSRWSGSQYFFRGLLQYHIINGTALYTSNTTAFPAQGNTTVPTALKHMNVTLSRTPLLSALALENNMTSPNNTATQFYVNNATLLPPYDVNVSNGVIHPINKILTPLLFIPWNFTLPGPFGLLH